MNRSGRTYNGPYTGESVDHIAFPVGGIGAGCFCLQGTGALGNFSLRHQPDINNDPFVEPLWGSLDSAAAEFSLEGGA